MKALTLAVALALSVCHVWCRVPASGCQVVESPECFADQKSITFHPHETDCAKFYVCNNGYLSSHVCPMGEYFYDNSELCAPEHYVECNRCATNIDRSQLCGDCGCEEPTTLPEVTTERVTPEETLMPTTERVTPEIPTTERITPEIPTTERITPEIPTTERVTPEIPTTERVTPEILTTERPLSI